VAPPGDFKLAIFGAKPLLIGLDGPDFSATATVMLTLGQTKRRPFQVKLAVFSAPCNLKPKSRADGGAGKPAKPSGLHGSKQACQGPGAPATVTRTQHEGPSKRCDPPGAVRWIKAGERREVSGA
jgi:hypothetical protein